MITITVTIEEKNGTLEIYSRGEGVVEGTPAEKRAAALFKLCFDTGLEEIETMTKIQGRVVTGIESNQQLTPEQIEAVKKAHEAGIAYAKKTKITPRR